MTVLESDIPPLLSVGLLDHLGAQIDLKENHVAFKGIGIDLEMSRLPSGHRTIPLSVGS